MLRAKKEKRPAEKPATDPFIKALKRMVEADAEWYVSEEEGNPLVLDFKRIENTNKKENEYKNVRSQLTSTFRKYSEVAANQKLFTLSLSGETKQCVLEWLEKQEAEKHPCYKILTQAMDAGATAEITEIDGKEVLQLNFASIENDTKRTAFFSLAKEKLSQNYGDYAKTNGKPHVLLLSGPAKTDIAAWLADKDINLSGEMNAQEQQAASAGERTSRPRTRANTFNYEKKVKQPQEGVSAPAFLTALYNANTAEAGASIPVSTAIAGLTALEQQLTYFTKPINTNLPNAKKVRPEDALMIQLRECPAADRLQLVQWLGFTSIRENMKPTHTLDTTAGNAGFTMSYARPAHETQQEAWDKGMEAVTAFTNSLTNISQISAEEAYDCLTTLRQQLKARNEQPMMEAEPKPLMLAKPVEENKEVEETDKQKRTRLRLEKQQADKEAARETPQQKRARILNSCTEDERAATAQNLAREMIRQAPAKSSINISRIALEDGFNITLSQLPGESRSDWDKRTSALSDLIQSMVPDGKQTASNSGKIIMKLPSDNASYEALMDLSQRCQQARESSLRSL